MRERKGTKKLFRRRSKRRGKRTDHALSSHQLRDDLWVDLEPVDHEGWDEIGVGAENGERERR